jgi:hypothetical protein
MKCFTTILLLLPGTALFAVDPHPLTNPESPLMPAGPWEPENMHRLDFADPDAVAMPGQPLVDQAG